MSLRLNCPKCNKSFRTPNDDSLSRHVCPHCGELAALPTPMANLSRDRKGRTIKVAEPLDDDEGELAQFYAGEEPPRAPPRIEEEPPIAPPRAADRRSSPATDRDELVTRQPKVRSGDRKSSPKAPTAKQRGMQPGLAVLLVALGLGTVVAGIAVIVRLSSETDSQHVSRNVPSKTDQDAKEGNTKTNGKTASASRKTNSPAIAAAKKTTKKTARKTADKKTASGPDDSGPNPFAVPEIAKQKPVFKAPPPPPPAPPPITVERIRALFQRNAQRGWKVTSRESYLDIASLAQAIRTVNDNRKNPIAAGMIAPADQAVEALAKFAASATAEQISVVNAHAVHEINAPGKGAVVFCRVAYRVHGQSIFAMKIIGHEKLIRLDVGKNADQLHQGSTWLIVGIHSGSVGTFIINEKNVNYFAVKSRQLLQAYP
jgi:hypothetical protein